MLPSLTNTAVRRSAAAQTQGNSGRCPYIFNRRIWTLHGAAGGCVRLHRSETRRCSHQYYPEVLAPSESAELASVLKRADNPPSLPGTRAELYAQQTVASEYFQGPPATRRGGSQQDDASSATCPLRYHMELELGQQPSAAGCPPALPVTRRGDSRQGGPSSVVA